MIWAKVVNDEIIQTWEEDPSSLWHPDALQNWEQVPDDVNVGWKRKNGQWITGAQWLEEHQAENPLPPPGPPTAGIKRNVMEKETLAILELEATPAGHFDSISWSINGQTYTDSFVTVEIPRTSVVQSIPVSLTVTGPGGSDTKELTGDEEITIAKIIVV